MLLESLCWWPTPTLQRVNPSPASSTGDGQRAPTRPPPPTPQKDLSPGPAVGSQLALLAILTGASGLQAQPRQQEVLCSL